MRRGRGLLLLLLLLLLDVHLRRLLLLRGRHSHRPPKSTASSFLSPPNSKTRKERKRALSSYPVASVFAFSNPNNTIFLAIAITTPSSLLPFTLRYAPSPPPMRPLPKGRSAMARGGFANVTLFMISCFACFYVAGRLWQDSERRLILINLLDKSTGGGKKLVTVEDKLEFLGCKDVEKNFAEAQMELAAARSQGYTHKLATSGNSTVTGRRLSAVIGISTEFGNRLRRQAIRKKWMPTGEALTKLEKEKGIVVRFVVGRSANKGDSSDRRIDSENKERNDFFILDKHVEVSEEFAKKAKAFFSLAVETWDADFYIKADDDVFVNIDELGKVLSSYWDKPRAYIGCMKSGDVITEEGQRWYEKESWKFGDGKSYFRHAGGQFYILSRAVAQYIYVNRDFLHTYTHEDISVGSWMIGLDLELIDERRACCGSPPKGSICTAM